MTRMNFEQIVDFILERLDVPAPDRRATRDKVRKRVRYALGDGTLPRIDILSMDVDRDELICWARSKWPGKFNIPVSIRGFLSDQVKLTGNTEGLLLPADVDTCHALLLQKRALLQAMEAKCRALENIIADLRPDAEKYRQMREKNRLSAKRPRG